MTVSTIITKATGGTIPGQGKAPGEICQGTATPKGPGTGEETAITTIGTMMADVMTIGTTMTDATMTGITMAADSWMTVTGTTETTITAVDDIERALGIPAENIFWA